MMTILAEAAAAADPGISGTAVAGIIGAITTLVVGVIGKLKLEQAKSDSRDVTIKQPVPTVPMSKVSTPPSWDAHVALCDRMNRQEQISNELRHDLSEVRKDMAQQYRDLLKAGHDQEQRISDKLEGMERGIRSRIDELMKPKTTR